MTATHTDATPVGSLRKPRSRRIGPLNINDETSDAVIETLLTRPSTAKATQVAFANTHLLYCAIKERKVQDALHPFLLLNDGVGMTLLSRLATGQGFHENLNGTDFVPRLLAAAPAGYRVFLVGSTRAVVDRAARTLSSRHPLLVVCGAEDGFSGNLDSEEFIQALAVSAPDIVLVALGNPHQEQWIGTSAARLDRGLFIGVGALFDFIAKDKPRAPLFLRRARLEWMFRLLLEPKRLWRRYTIELVVVTIAVLRQRQNRAETPSRQTKAAA
ncbi:MAG: WecB/TagA/CpsF family glycosyltransferase [Hyphomonadaceae bacterium]|nr:WecB/TagA/CpsF family glycosyltransferase [Hyphomonadaceae bacterium]